MVKWFNKAWATYHILIELCLLTPEMFESFINEAYFYLVTSMSKYSLQTAIMFTYAIIMFYVVP